METAAAVSDSSAAAARNVRRTIRQVQRHGATTSQQGKPMVVSIYLRTIVVSTINSLHPVKWQKQTKMYLVSVIAKNAYKSNILQGARLENWQEQSL